jgi:hypothetical protein
MSLQPEVGDDGRPSISTRSDGRHRPIPIRPAWPLAGGPSRSALWASIPRAPVPIWAGPIPSGPDLLHAARIIFFRNKSFKLCFVLLGYKIHILVSEHPKIVIQIFLSSSSPDLSIDTACIILMLCKISVN